jgi:hypothetical protein
MMPAVTGETGEYEMNKCDVCGSEDNVKAGRWIFYCPEHKQVDLDKTYDNEIAPSLENGETTYLTMMISLKHCLT